MSPSRVKPSLELWNRQWLLKARPGQPRVILLSFQRSDDKAADLHFLFRSLKGLQELNQQGMAIQDLRRHGLAAVVCSSEGEARRLADGIDTGRIGVRVLTDQGRWVVWRRAEPKWRRRGQRPCRSR